MKEILISLLLSILAVSSAFPSFDVDNVTLNPSKVIQIHLQDCNNSDTTNILDKLHNITRTLQENLEQTQKSNEYNIEAIEKKLEDSFKQIELTLKLNIENIDKKLEAHSKTIEAELVRVIEKIEKKLEGHSKPESLGLTLGSSIIAENEIKTPEPTTPVIDYEPTTLEQSETTTTSKNEIDEEYENILKTALEFINLEPIEKIISENEIEDEDVLKTASESTTLEQSETTTTYKIKIEDEDFLKFVFESTKLEQSEKTISENEIEDEDVLKTASESTTLEQSETTTTSKNEIADEDVLKTASESTTLEQSVKTIHVYDSLENDFDSWFNENESSEEVTPFKPEPNPIQIGSKKYFIEHEKKVNWTSASENCRNMQAKLAILETEEELLEVRKHLDRVNYWIGLNDREHEGTYVTEEGLPAKFLKWQQYEPSNGEGDEDCIELKYMYHEHLMNDLGCATNVLYICEFDN